MVLGPHRRVHAGDDGLVAHAGVQQDLGAQGLHHLHQRLEDEVLGVVAPRLSEVLGPDADQNRESNPYSEPDVCSRRHALRIEVRLAHIGGPPQSEALSRQRFSGKNRLTSS